MISKKGKEVPAVFLFNQRNPVGLIHYNVFLYPQVQGSPVFKYTFSNQVDT